MVSIVLDWAAAALRTLPDKALDRRLIIRLRPSTRR
jgi:hypothetical protein